MSPHYKSCRCCSRSFSREEWDALPLLGIQPCEGDSFLELKNCSCASTLAVEVTP